MDTDDKTIVIELVLWPFKTALHAALMWTGWFQEEPETCPLCQKHHEEGLHYMRDWDTREDK